MQCSCSTFGIRFPTGEELEQVIVDFERLSVKSGKAGLPLCAGAMDGTFMKISKPSLWGDLYYCYKSFIAIVILAVQYQTRIQAGKQMPLYGILAVVDARCIFTHIDAGRAGSMGDAYTYNHS